MRVSYTRLATRCSLLLRVLRLSSYLKRPSRGVLCSRVLPGNFRSTTVVGSYRCADKDCSTALVQFCLGRLAISFRPRRSLGFTIEVTILTPPVIKDTPRTFDLHQKSTSRLDGLSARPGYSSDGKDVPGPDRRIRSRKPRNISARLQESAYSSIHFSSETPPITSPGSHSPYPRSACGSDNPWQPGVAPQPIGDGSRLVYEPSTARTLFARDPAVQVSTRSV